MTEAHERELEAARAAMASTRHDLATRLHRAASLSAPSRLASLGAAAAREAATAKAADLGQRVLGVAVTQGRRPRVLGGVAGALAPMAYLLLRRRRRKAAKRPSRLETLIRVATSPTLGVALSLATMLLKRRGR